MGKIAFLFAGQGAQATGMGKSLYDLGGAAREVFEWAEEVRPGTMSDCFEGSAERLAETEVTQPCVFCVDVAAACALLEMGLAPDALAGFSLGEVAALAFDEMTQGQELDKEAFVKWYTLVCRRAELMAVAGKESPGGMCAVLKMEDSAVEELCREFTEKTGKGFYPVNYNSPGQLVVAGAKDCMEEFAALVKSKRGIAKPLPVSGAFHSPYMESAAVAFAEELDKADLYPVRLPLYANLTANEYEDVAATLGEQMRNPVQWTRTIHNMVEDGYDTFVEVGPGKTLRGLVKRIEKDTEQYNVQHAEDLASLVALAQQQAASDKQAWSVKWNRRAKQPS